MKYNADYFIKKLSKIPAKLWITCTVTKDEDGACCVLGHVGTRTLNGNYKFTREAKALVDLFGGDHTNVTDINDLGDGDKGRPVKNRVLAALRKLKKEGK